MSSPWIRLCGDQKTMQTYRIIHLLKEHRICARTLPDEFNGYLGPGRMLCMDPQRIWPILVKEKQLEQALRILSQEQ